MTKNNNKNKAKKNKKNSDRKQNKKNIIAGKLRKNKLLTRKKKTELKRKKKILKKKKKLAENSLNKAGKGEIVIKKSKIEPAKKNNPDEEVHRAKIRIIGIGGGGGSIVSELASRIKKVDFVVANTDIRSLKNIKRARHFHFGKELTKGLGTGMNPEMGELAAQNEKEKIKKIFEGQDVCIIISSLGGGTGCGATPVFAKIAKNLNCLTYGIFTLPFEFEGGKKMEIAKEALLKIRPYLNIYSVIPNERIFKIIDRNTPLGEALSAINNQLADNLQGLIEMIYSPGLINIDFADLRTILSGSGRLAYLNKIEIKDIEKEEIVTKLISSQLYPYTIQGARGILYNISGGKNLQLLEVARISKTISDSVNKNAKIIFGIHQKPQNNAKIDLTILAVGCNFKNDFLKEKEKEKSKKDYADSLKSGKKNKKLKKENKIKVAGQIKEEIEKAFSERNRRNALQVKQAIEEEEKKLLEQEKMWEAPAIFRKKNKYNS